MPPARILDQEIVPDCKELCEMKNFPIERSRDRADAGTGLHLRFYPDAVLRTVPHPIERFDSWLACSSATRSDYDRDMF